MGLRGRSQVWIKDATVATRRGLLPWLRRVSPNGYTDADPFKVIHIPPAQITAMQRRWSGPIELPWLDTGRWQRQSSLLRRWHAGLVLDGDWDQAVKLFKDYHLWRVVRDRYQRGKDWQDIDYIKSAYRKIEQGRPAWGNRCHTPADVVERCNYLDQLYNRLQTEGYCSDPSQARQLTLPYTHFLVNIGRHGEIIRNNDGKHRILLSKVLGIPYLSAKVFVRHRQWQALRDTIRAGKAPELVEQYRHHPDLQDILSTLPPESAAPESA